MSLRERTRPGHYTREAVMRYGYTGKPCKSGYQLGPGNCRKADGRMVAVAKEQCVGMGGLVALPFEGGRPPPKFMK